MLKTSLLRNILIFVGAAHLCGSLALAQGVITTVAGNGSIEFTGDGGPATSAGIYYATDVAVDGVGNLYIADYGNNRIRKVSTSGTITTVAGNGGVGFSGDGGPATSASFRDPRYLAVDGAGNIYIADRTNYRIRKVNAAGIITTVAGTGTQGFSGDGGPAASAQISAPFGMAVDSAGNLYFADNLNHRIRKVTTAGIITTVAGNGTAGFSGDGGPATSASINSPWGVAVDAAGNVYFTDYSNSRVRKVTTAGIISTVAGGGNDFPGDGGSATSAALPFITELAADSAGNIYISEGETINQVRKVSTAGIISTAAGNGTRGFSGDGGAATSAQLSLPEGLALDSSGNLYIADPGNNRIRKVTPSAASTFSYYMSHLALGEGWQTTITYINYSPTTVTCSTSFFSDTGTPLAVPFGGAAASSRTDTLPPGGAFHQQSTFDLNAAVVTGWGRAECNGPVKASLLFRYYQQGQPSGEAGVNAMSSPATKFVTFGEQRTGVAYANPSAQAAQVTFKAISSTGAILATKNITLQPGEHGSANLEPLLGLSSFTGSLQIVSSVPIVSLSLNFEAFPAFSSLPPGELDGATPLR